MDALRRAEASTAESPADDEPVDAAPAPPDTPDTASALELEPVNTPLPDMPVEASNNEVVNREAPAEAESTPAEPHAPQQQARAAMAALTTHPSARRKQVVFAVSGIATVAILLSGYYFWQSRQHVAPQVPSTATLIDTPAALNDADGETLRQTGSTAADTVTEAVSTVNPVVAATNRATEPPAATAVAETSRDDPAPTPIAQPYRIEIHKSRRPGKVPTALKQAYQNYQRQAYTEAEQGYRKVLRRYPGNRDAMLGLAAIALHQGNRQVAHYYYKRLLQADPADKTASLALQSLSGGQYSLENGSQIKYWLQTDKNNAQLHFALGNQYAAAGQWKEAQQAYFEAHRITPANADYAFNLGVSLDQLQLPRQALDYYVQARDLAGKSGALFNPQQLERRIAQLQSITEPSP